jgi:hypothetical protein
MGGAGESIVVNLSVLFTRAAHCQPDAGRKAGVPATEIPAQCSYMRLTSR